MLNHLAEENTNVQVTKSRFIDIIQIHIKKSKIPQTYFALYIYYYAVSEGFFLIFIKTKTLYALTKFPLILIDLKIFPSEKERKKGKC